MNILELVFCRHIYSFLLGKFLRVQLWDHKVCPCFTSLNIGSSSKRAQTSPFLPPNLTFLPPLKHLPSAVVIRPASWLAFFSPQDKWSPLLEAHKIMWILQTARSLHSPLHLPQGSRWQGSSPSQEHPSVLSIFQHGGPESKLGFQTDLSSLRGATTVFSTVHFFGQTIVLVHIITISPEEDSGEEAHLRKEEGREKCQTCSIRGGQYPRKDYKNSSVFFFQIKIAEFETYVKHHWLEIVLLASSEDTGV